MLVVGHNCPGCGLDTPAVACEACGADVVWDRESGSHCSACDRAASTFTCAECGLRTELDRRPPEPAARAMSPSEDDNAAQQAPAPSPALLARFSTALAAAPLMRTLAIAAVGLHGLAIALLVGTYDGGAAPRSDVAIARVVAAPAPDRLTRGVVELSLDAKPVPLQPPPPGAEPPPPMPEPRLALSPPPAVVSRVDTSPRPAPRGEGWLQRVLRSGRAYSPASDRFPADTAGIGR